MGNCCCLKFFNRQSYTGGSDSDAAREPLVKKDSYTIHKPVSNASTEKPKNSLYPPLPAQKTPPMLFKRLDSYLKQENISAHEFFSCCDKRKRKSISYNEFVVGLNEVGFELFEKEVDELSDWIEVDLDGSMTFKEIALALKLRSAATSPQKTVRPL